MQSFDDLRWRDYSRDRRMKMTWRSSRIFSSEERSWNNFTKSVRRDSSVGRSLRIVEGSGRSLRIDKEEYARIEIVEKELRYLRFMREDTFRNDCQFQHAQALRQTTTINFWNIFDLDIEVSLQFVFELHSISFGRRCHK
jgi:hypothetical protein